MRDGQRPDYVAGLSIGAYAAAVVAESLTFADALRPVALRGELMQQAYPEGYGMTAILGLALGTVESLLAEAEGPVYPATSTPTTRSSSPAAMPPWPRSRRGPRCWAPPARGAGDERALALRAARAAGTAAVGCLHRGGGARPADSLPQRLLGASAVRRRAPARRPAFNMCRVVDWHGTLRTAYERGCGCTSNCRQAVLTGLARRVFEQGTLVAFDGARLDTLDALLRQEGSQSR